MTRQRHRPPPIPVPAEITGLPWWQSSAVFDEDTGELLSLVLVDTPEGAPHDVREGLTRRRLAALDGVCVCGARLVIGTRAERRAAERSGRQPIGAPRVAHRPDCPGDTAVLAAAIARWEQRDGAL
jgi:hypothetical protein